MAKKKNTPIKDLSHLPDWAFLRLPDVLALRNCSASHWWDGIAKNTYPPGKKVGKRMRVWTVGEIRNIQ